MIEPNRVIQESFSPEIGYFRNDRVVYEDAFHTVKLSQLLHRVFGDRVTPYPKRQLQRGRGIASDLSPGWVHLGQNKKDLSEQRSTTFIRTYSTMLEYVAKGYEYMTFGTFHTRSRRAVDRKRQRLNSVRVFVIDIDSKKWGVQDILQFCSQEGILPPSWIAETVRGYHVWYVLEKDFVGPHAKGDQLTAVGSFYNDINRFLIEAYQKAFPANEGGADALVGGERYIRIPTNLVYYSDHTYSINDFVQIRNELNPLSTKKTSHPKKQKLSPRTFIPAKALHEDPAYVKLLTMQPAYGKRRYTAFTIALLFYSMNMPIEEAIEWLQGWYDRLADKDTFTWKEVDRAIQSAYFSNKHHGPSNKWMITLTGLQPKTFFTRRKKQEERIYKTFDHWEQQFLIFLREQGGRCELSNRELCLTLELTSRAMLEKIVQGLIEKGMVEKIVTGRGRGASTVYLLLSPKEPERKITEENETLLLPSNVIKLDEYRRLRRNSSTTLLNDPDPYRNIKEFIREGGRDVSFVSDPKDDPGG